MAQPNAQTAWEIAQTALGTLSRMRDDDSPRSIVSAQDICAYEVVNDVE